MELSSGLRGRNASRHRPFLASARSRRHNGRKEDSVAEQQVIGGGAKKVLYTLDTLRRIGVGKAAKALTAKNTCKACGYGMGGQLGGMTNELGEFPSVCNKSVQAQSTDIQAPIPHGIFEHEIADLAELSGREMEHLGRLNTPLFKARGDDRYRAGRLGLRHRPRRRAAQGAPIPTAASSIPPAARRTRPASCSSCSPGPGAPTTSTTARTTATRRPARASRPRSARAPRPSSSRT